MSNTTETICQKHAPNLATIIHAAKHDRLCLMECTVAATGETVAVLCAVNRDRDGDAIEMVPMATMFNGNPYNELLPPFFFRGGAEEERLIHG